MMCFVLAEYLMLYIDVDCHIAAVHIGLSFSVHLSSVLPTYAESDISYFFGVLNHTCVEEFLNSVSIVSQDLN